MYSNLVQNICQKTERYIMENFDNLSYSKFIMSQTDDKFVT